MFLEGADDGSRTHTPLFARTDFKSVASTIPPHRRCGVHSKLFARFAKMHFAVRTDSDAAAPINRTAPPGKPVIKQFIRSPNCSCGQVGTRIDKIVLHCTEGSLASALAEFQRTDSRKVSAHYVIDRNGDIYQMVNEADCANHCMGANAGSIGIEHVGSETDSLAPPQAAASAALIRWLLQEHQITRTNIWPRFHTGLQPTGRDQLPGQSLRSGALTSHDRCLGRG